MKKYGKDKKKFLKKVGRRQEEKKRGRLAGQGGRNAALGKGGKSLGAEQGSRSTAAGQGKKSRMAAAEKGFAEAAALLGVQDCRTQAEKRKLARAAALARHTQGASRHGKGDTRCEKGSPRYEKGGARQGRGEDKITEGIFHGTSRGFGFVTPAEPGEAGADIFIPAHSVGDALDGDSVRVRYHTYTARGAAGAEQKTEGTVLSVLHTAHHAVIGTLLRGESGYGHRRHTYWYVQPEDGRLPGEIWLPGPGSARNGDKVEVALEKDRSRGLRGHVVRAFGPAEDRVANYEAVLAAQNVRTSFPPAVLEEATQNSAVPLSREGRVCRDREVILTIDGASAKDLDDAVSLRRLPDGGWLLGVHIADVSHYVPQNSALEAEAILRGTSLYFIDCVVPMLPPALSNGACSLNAGEDKYALSAVMTLDAHGVIRSTTVSRSLIRSRVRGVYEEVNDLFAAGKASPFYKKYAAVWPTLSRMRELYRVLEGRNRARGALSFDRPEATILLDEDGAPADIVCRERGEAERMIEQFMLTANEGVATLMQKKGYPCVYRVHDKPEPGRLADFALYAHNLGLDTRPLQKEPEALSGADLAAVLCEAEEKGLSRAVSYTMLRAMAKAVYSDKATGHFGLGIPLYCHFTSPIRRLSDLATHRMVKAVLLDGMPPDRYRAYAHRNAEAASEGELRALEAEREIEALYKTLYMKKHLSETFEGQISSVTSFGLFVELENTCEGLIPLTDLPGHFVFDEKSLSLRAGDTVYRIGDPVRITVAEADIPTRRVRFSLENSEK